MINLNKMDTYYNSKIAFTICSNNYLAQAKTLGDSLLKNNPDYRFIIGLVDKKNSTIDYSFFEPYEIMPVDEICIDNFEEMSNRYNLLEFNTAVKPFYFDFLLKTFSEVNIFIYFDPDIYIYNSLNILNEGLDNFDILLTPHFFTPINDDFLLKESQILNCGLYNLGFIGIKRSPNSYEFINWWKIKLTDQCYIDFQKGLFVDQLWINLVPIYFENVLILKNKGLNVAYWNLHERKISYYDNNYWINKKDKLVFFHFSGYNFKYDENSYISKYQTRYKFKDRNDLQKLFLHYTEIVTMNNYNFYILIKCYYEKIKKETHKDSLKKKIFNYLKILHR